MPDNEVKIIFTGVDDVSPVVNKISGEIGGTSGTNGLDDLRAQFAEAKKSSIDLSEGVSTVEAPLISMSMAAGLAAAAVAAIGVAIYSANQEFVEYGTAVYDIGQKYEISAEFASRYIQVSEDLGMSQGELEKALTKVKAQGLDPAGEGFSKLADELGVTEDSFRELVYSVDEAQVLSQDMADTAHNQQLAVEEMTNAWDNFQVTLGAKVSPVITTVLEGLVRTNEIRDRANELVKEGASREQALAQAAEEVAEKHKDAENATADYVFAAEDAKDAINEQSKAFQDLLKSMTKVQGINDKFIEGEQDRADKIKEIEDDKVRSVIEASQKREELERDLANLAVERSSALAKIDNDSTNAALRRQDIKRRFAEKEHDIEVKLAALRDDAAVEQIKLNEKITEIEQEGTEAIQEKEDALKKLLYAQLESKAVAESSAGGTQVTKEEFEFLQNMQVELGLTDAASANAAIAIAEDAQSIWDAFTDATGGVNDVQAALDAVVHGSPYKAQIIIETVGGVPNIRNTFGKSAVNSANYGPTGRGATTGLSLDWLAQETNRRNTRY